MSQQLLKPAGRLALAALVALALVLSGSAPAGQSTTQAAAVQPVVVAQVFDVNCTSLAAVTPTYAKLLDLATFSVQSPDALVEITFNGRIFVGSFASGTGAVFELRVDDAATTQGRARANLRASEAGGHGNQATITGIFTGLAAGNHTASMWVRTSVSGAGTQAMVDPGCWSSDALIVKEYPPFGYAYLPSLLKP